MKSTGLGGLVLALFISAPAFADEQPKPNYSPEITRDYPTNVYWGDTHLHTKYSFDANSAGPIQIGPHEAYQFAKGETVTAHNGMQVKLRRPLDFLLIADHSEYLALSARLDSADPLLLNTEVGKRWHEMKKGGVEQNLKMYNELVTALTNNIDEIKDDKFSQSVWDEVAANAEQHNQPGVFTAFIGYEWSTTTAQGDNLHRNVLFRDGADKVTKLLPFSSLHSNDPADLWKHLEKYQETTGGQVLAIPHNGNLSNGLMFSRNDIKGNPLTPEYAAARAKWEPLVEATQYKGDSEAHPFLSPTDEFADYETWDRSNILMREKHQDWMTEFEYARPALKLGLEFEQNLGINPFKFGLIGSTDSHTGLATADENNFWGKFPNLEPGGDRWSQLFLEKLVGRKIDVYNWQISASGYAAVWAQENTRESLFDAMMRKETYASTGPRITLRFFGGWDYQAQDAQRANLAEIGYSKGVPMGGDLTTAPAGQSPKFLIRAVKDPDGANLDRIQIIKGWLDDQGKLQEKIYNLAVSDSRKIDAEGKTTPAGNTVDVADASYTNSIGDPELAVVWQDPDFNQKQRAFYYVRVLEIPTPRWTAYDAKYLGITMREEVKMTTQERVYSSPIWYTP